MPVANIDGLELAYDVIGDTGDDAREPWVITPGGRFSKDYGGIREMAQALADAGKRVLIWDRPNCGASQVCFDGPPESVLQPTPWPACCATSTWRPPWPSPARAGRGCRS
jgi:pimeloyl-ACP methyl ester carboxylesterase